MAERHVAAHRSARRGGPPGSHAALRGIDLRLEGDAPVAVLGANGAGKSVLLRTLHGLIAPTEGAVLWSGSSVRPRDQAMVFQRPVMLRRSTLANVEYALAVNGVRGAARRSRAGEALARVGLASLAARPARVLSGGEQQRLALARAWALRPRVIFLDEPTASLDPAAATEVERDHRRDPRDRDRHRLHHPPPGLRPPRRLRDRVPARGTRDREDHCRDVLRVTAVRGGGRIPQRRIAMATFARFLNRLTATWIAAALVAAVALAFSSGSRADEFITVASTTSTEQSGLFKYLLPEAKKALGIRRARGRGRHRPGARHGAPRRRRRGVRPRQGRRGEIPRRGLRA